ncbi:MAG: GGDEF domain-containing protein [Lachnospiraceae bacterium]|nr:GGDEF domain-containing protein [Lachnospiraceae bacterium]
MKKRIAVFANGWSNDYLQEVTEGILKSAKEHNSDTFVFVNHSAYAESERQNRGESNIFRLPDMTEFDGVILLANSFNSDSELAYLRGKIKETKIPAVSLEYRIDDVTTVITDTYSGMYSLVNHVISEHGARRILYIGGTKGHPDSNTRLCAVIDAAEKYGIVISDGDILYADFAKKLAVSEFNAWFDDNKALPDAIICANDVMALGICEWVEGNGYVVPDDVIVTGYDCTRLGQRNYPSLTTVNHDWNKLGYTAVNVLMDNISSSADGGDVVLDSELVLGGSCGCEQDKNIYNRVRRDIKENKIDGLLSDSHFRHIYLSIRKASDKEGLTKCLASFFEREHWMEGDGFMLCLEPEFFNIVDDDSNLRDEGYSDRMNVICSLRGGAAEEAYEMSTREAVFRRASESENPGLYIYVPLHNEGRTYGFAMLSRDIYIVIDNYLYIWTRHMYQYLEQVRNNITIAELTKKLTELSVTDVLTGVYNRFGCDRIMYPMLNNCSSQGITCALMMVDIDKLKIINDIYGHAGGDLAICTVASVLRETLPNDWIIVRFGGDEFLAGGMCDGEEAVREISECIEDGLRLETERKNIKFALSVSIGYVMLESGGQFNIEKSLSEADEKMYRIKQKHHDGLLLEKASV